MTELGQEILSKLCNKWLQYTDKNDENKLKRIKNTKQLEKYYQKSAG